MSASDGSLISLAAVAAAFFAGRGFAVAGTLFFFAAVFAEAVFSLVPVFFAADLVGCDAATGEGAISSVGDAELVFDFFGTVLVFAEIDHR